MSEVPGVTAPPAPPPPPRRRRRVWPWVLVAVALVVLFVSLLANVILLSAVGTRLGESGKVREELVSGDPQAKDKVALVAVKGVITDAAGGFFAPGTFRSSLEQLERAAQDEAVKAVLLEVDSPGGEVTASDVLWRKVTQLKKETGKPVVVSMGSMATSGGYYVSSAADRIVAQPTTVTGSIGVLMSLLNAQGLVEKVGLQSVVIKSAEHKDLGSPFREMTPEEQAILQGVVDHLFTRFKTLVAEGRELTAEQVTAVADGRILTAQEALETGLIDRIGYLDEAIAEAKQLAGTPDAKVIRYRRAFGLGDIFTSQLEGWDAPRTVTVRVAGLPGPRTARFLYMWLLGGEAWGAEP